MDTNIAECEPIDSWFQTIFRLSLSQSVEDDLHFATVTWFEGGLATSQ